MARLSSILFSLLAASRTLADFTIYIGKTNDITDVGVTYATTQIQIHSHAPLSCSDVGHVVAISMSSINDASKGRWACDGCNALAPRDWAIKRLEMYNYDDAVAHSTDHPFPLFNRATGAVSTYGHGLLPGYPISAILRTVLTNTSQRYMEREMGIGI